jgi:modification methylase
MKRGTRGKHGDLHCAGDVWVIPYKTTGRKKKKATAGLAHSYGFPEELAERCLKVANIAPGCTVLDPFMGSGTTACVAKRMGFHALGIELDDEAAAVARARWEKVGHDKEDAE